MKKIFIIGIIFYRKLISPVIKQLLGVGSMCRFTPSCSEYAILSIEKYGLTKGLKMGLIRLLHCQPFSHNYANI